jgi:hypothetical protein
MSSLQKAMAAKKRYILFDACRGARAMSRNAQRCIAGRIQETWIGEYPTAGNSTHPHGSLEGADLKVWSVVIGEWKGKQKG